MTRDVGNRTSRPTVTERALTISAAARSLTKAVLAELTLSPFANRCKFCGRRSYGKACEAHRDLVQLEAALYQGDDR